MNYGEAFELMNIDVLEDLVAQNFKPKTIRFFLAWRICSLSFSRHLVEEIIKEKLNRRWDKSMKTWVSINDDGPLENIITDVIVDESLISSSMVNESKDDTITESIIIQETKDEALLISSMIDEIADSIATNNNDGNLSENTFEMDPNKMINDNLSKLFQGMDAIIDRLTKFEDKVSNIDRTLEDFLKDKTVLEKNKKCDINEFIKIYAGEKIKRSITINVEIEKLIEDFMYQNYSIKDNGSLAINSALLLALYSNFNDDKVELEDIHPLDDLGNDKV